MDGEGEGAWPDGEPPYSGAIGGGRRLHPGRGGYSEAVAGEVLQRVAAGETLHRVSEAAGMPSYPTLCKWTRTRAGFREGLEAARRQAGARWRTPGVPYCDATFTAIFDRLCQGEGLVRICADVGMPTTATVYNWLGRDPELREALLLARLIHGDRMGELAEGECMAVTMENWRAQEVRLRHLRWWAGKLAPRTYGTHRATEPAPGLDGEGDGAAAEPEATRFYFQRFGRTADGRWVDITHATHGLEPAEIRALQANLREGRIRVEDTPGCKYCDEGALRRGEF